MVYTPPNSCVLEPLPNKSFKDISTENDGFPLSFSKDPARVEELLTRLEEWAVHPAAADLTGLEFTLVKHGPESNIFKQTEFPLHKDQWHPVRHFRGMKTSKWDYCQTGCKHFDLRTPRPPPAEFATTKATVTLKTALEVGPALESQVYKGTLEPRSESLGGRAADVVIKIWQMSRMASFEKLKEWVLYTVQDVSPYSKMMQGFRVESYWYRYMAPIQGSYVPHVYGLFEVVLPNGEPSIVLITEYISGTPLLQYVTDRAHAQKLLPIVGKAVASAVHALNMRMVGIRDWHPSNFIVINENEGSGNVEIEIVIVDFDQARPVHRSHRTRMLCQVNSLLEEVGFHKDAVDDWIRKCVDPASFAPAENPYITAFDIDTDQLDVMRRLVGINPGRRIVS